MFQQYFGQTVFAIDTRSICERGSGFARRHAALENARTGGGKQSARARVRRGRCRDAVSTATTTIYGRRRRRRRGRRRQRAFGTKARGVLLRRLQRSAKPVTCRASRDAPRWTFGMIEPVRRPPAAAAAAAAPAVTPFFLFARGEGEKREERKVREERSGGALSDIPLFWSLENGVCAARDRTNRLAKCVFKRRR